VKRLVLCAASAMVSCVSLTVVTAGTAAGAAAVSGSSVVGVAGDNGAMIPTPLAPHTRRIRGTTMSDNWSGYAQVSATENTFTEVTDTFVVPTVQPLSKGTQYAADWVGIGGYNDTTLVQTGIQTVVRTRKHQTTVTYDAWTEHLPKPEVPLPNLTISAGDTVTATVQETGTDTWLMEVSDITTGQSQSVTVDYDSSGESAEAIHERPCIKSPCHAVDLAHLAQTANVTFGPGFYSTSPPGQPAVLQPLLDTSPNLTLNDIIMTNNKQTKPIATPSSPSLSGDGFAVADGVAAPPPPND
jgi:peptidase A4-like protein